jgi:hypothetical protein
MSFQTTIAQIKQGINHPVTQRLYVIEGEGCVLYVGQSKCAVTRMESHLNMGPWRAFFGASIDNVLINEQGADTYTVSFYDDTDIEALSAQDGCRESVSCVESKLIYELSPVFNAQGKKKHSDNINRWYALHPPEVIEMEEMWNDDEAE